MSWCCQVINRWTAPPSCQIWPVRLGSDTLPDVHTWHAEPERSPTPIYMALHSVSDPVVVWPSKQTICNETEAAVPKQEHRGFRRSHKSHWFLFIYKSIYMLTIHTM